MSDCCIYVRISNDKGKDTEDEGMGVARQEKECRALAKRLGLNVARVYCDNDVSAYSGKTRPEFESMLDGIKRGQYDAMVAWHQDRLYRSMKDIERVIEICDATNTPIHTVSGGDVDVTNATGKAVARILGSINRMESEHKAERIRSACAQRAEAGRWFTNCRMFGYAENGAAIDPSEAKLIRRAAEDLLSGRSMSSIIREWNAAGVATVRGNKWIPTTFRRLFTNPRYAALCEYKGKVVGPGDWPAILSPEDHAGLVAVFKDKSKGFKGVSWERKWIGTHRYLCGSCGAKMEHYVSKQAHAYRCSAHRHLARQQPAVDELVEQVALRFLCDEQKVAALLAAANKSAGVVDANELRSRRARLQAQKDELATLFTDGILDGPSVRREAAKLSDKIAALDSALAEVARRSPLAELMSEGVAQVEKRWAEASPDIKGKVIDELFTVVIKPLPVRGGRGFKPEYVDFVWHTR
jgi:site-specific DNA recombinase